MERVKLSFNKMGDQDFTLGQQIAKLQGIVEEGFKGVHVRQDISNGRIGKLEDRVGHIEKESSKNKGIKSGISTSWAVVISIISLGIAFSSTFLHH